MTSVLCREERAEDHAAVYQVHAAAFGQPAEAELVERLREESNPQLSLVATMDGETVGHVFVSPVQIQGAWPDSGNCGGLAPLGVHPKVQGRGVGSMLMRNALQRCRALGWSAIFLLGEPSYYARFGFELAAKRGFHYESHAFDKAFQYIELAPGALRGRTGWVHYHSAFRSL